MTKKRLFTPFLAAMLLKKQGGRLTKPILKPTTGPLFRSMLKKRLEINEPSKPTRMLILACNSMKRLGTQTHYYYTSLRYPTYQGVNCGKSKVDREELGSQAG